MGVTYFVVSGGVSWAWLEVEVVGDIGLGSASN